MIFPKERQTAELVAEHYDELDEIYREVWGEHVHHGFWRTGAESSMQAAEALTALVAERLGVRSGDTLCDIGCGYGASAEFMADRFAVNVTGLSLSKRQIMIAQSRVPAAGALTFVQRDWLENGLASARFDGAYAIESSEHMEDKPRFFSEAARVLRPGGRLVVCAWLASSGASKLAVQLLLEPICREGRLPSMGSREDYSALARRAGLDLVSFEDISAQVGRTWSICARRLVWKLLTESKFRRMALNPQVRNRSFLLSIPRLIVALNSGAMRYGLFVWTKPGISGGASSDASHR
jgi:tocopherol O-methyltransferase